MTRSQSTINWLLPVPFLMGGVAFAAEFKADIQPLLSQYCYRCHNPELRTGGINLQIFDSRSSVLEGREVWERVLRVLRETEMPPAPPLPSPAERLLLAEWVDDTINNVTWDDVRYPGHVTMSRLNAIEYNNTIRHLTGLDLRPADNFPADGEGESGFTNDRDGLFIPPLLMERYLQAADHVVAELIATRQTHKRLHEKVEVEDMRITETNTPLQPWGYDLWKHQDTLYKYVRFPKFGRYSFKVKAWGQSENEGEVPGVTVRVGGKMVGQAQVLATEEKPKVYVFEARIPRGNHQVSLHWYKAYTAASNDLNRELAAEAKQHREELEARGEEPKRNGKAVLVSLDFIDIEEAFEDGQDGSRVFLAGPGPGVSSSEAAHQVLANFASRAWRRPVKKAEVGYLKSLFERASKRGQDFEESIGLALKAVLVSPHFLFHTERSPGDRAERRLGHYEMASRLSYFLWMSMPDRELFSLAEKGRLHDDKVLREQVQRMIRDPKSRAFTETFAAQWLGYEGVGTKIKPDDVAFPEFTPALAEAMHGEAGSFFDTLIRKDRSLLELIESGYAYVNEQLARHYGIDGVVGPRIRSVPLENSHRGGILGMGAVLTATSLPVRTSAVVRGKWVLEKLLGEELPPPPPDAGELPSPTEETKTLTLRQMYELHRRGEQCAVCHKRIDPIGFGLENFDAIGRWRETEENGQPIDSTGELPDGEKFEGPGGLKRVLLRDREQFVRTVTEQMLRFALGRNLEYYDQPTIREITQAVLEGGYRPSVLINRIVTSYPFQYQAADYRPQESGS